MTTRIHIVENYKGELEIVDSSRLKQVNPDYKVQTLYPYKITKRFFDEDGEPNNYDEYVSIKHTFLVITKGDFILNDKDTSKLNAYTISGGFNQVNRLAYSYSVVVMISNSSSYSIWESDCIYSDAGIKSTRFDMYSYHVNDPVQKYTESRLDYEVYDSLNLTKILSKYLPKADVRDSVIDEILN